MAIGDTVQAGLMRVDFSPFLEAGRANAAANASFGNALGTIAKGYIEGQEKKARSEEMTGYLMNQGVSEKDAKAISKNPFLQKEYQRKKASEAQMKMEKERLATQSNIAAQGRAAKQAQIDQEYQREDEAKASVQQQTEAFYDRLNDTVPTDELTPEAQQRIDSFSSATVPTDPRRLAQVNDPQAFLERVQNDPSSYVQKPVYKLEGSDFLNQFEDPGMFQKAMAFQQANQPKAPDPQVQIKNENDLRKEFNALPEVKDFNKVRTSYDKVVLAGGNPSAAGDISMIFNYMKILDPGSVVREGEFATAQNAAGVPQRVVNQYNKIMKGERLSQDQRGDFMKQAQFAAKAQFKPVSEQMLRYEGVAQNMGLRFDQVLPKSFLTMGEKLEQEFKTKSDLNSDPNAITTDQGDYSIDGLSVEAQ